MKHQEYKRIVKNSKTAVLFIHGIIGSPHQFRDLIPLVPESFSIHNMLLPGHGGDTRSFGKASMKQWEDATEKALLSLAATCENIIVVGHSMGTLLAITLALKHPDKIKLLFLQAVPLFPMPRYQAFQVAHAILYKDESKYTKIEAQARDAYSITPDRDLTQYKGWYKRYIELFKKAREIRLRLGEITVPCIAIQSRQDELVSNRSEETLRNFDNILTYSLANSAHYIYSKEDKETMLWYFKEQMNKFI